ncbi:MAG: PD-(D/E)XK nuclease family protein [Verrucomicrobia bacterium]|nr:PD-(D/E)XK nuclease family protein [Verrucomicrobiota bacterium]
MTERPMFFSESFRRDSYAVAETLLKWRDDLIEVGWDGLASADDTIRIQDIVAVEARTGKRLSPGTSDRLRSVLLELNSRSPNLDWLAVRNSPSHLPKLWRLICAKLGARYEPAAFNPEANLTGETTDLGRIQSLLRKDNPTQRLKLNGDRSILCVTAFSEITLAYGTAQLLQHLRQVSNVEVTIVAAESASPLEQALSSLDEPTVGFQPGSTARPIPQVLLLALRLYWKPVNPRALLEFLAHPACPVAGVLRFKLANVIADCPGVGGPQWKAAIAATKESIENFGTLSAVEKQAATERIDQDLKDWLLVAEFDAKAGASGPKLSECCVRVARLAALQSVADGVSIIEVHQFRALASLSSEMAELLQSQPTIARSQLERLLHQVSGTGWPGGSAMEELGHIHRVAHPSAVNEPVDNVVWWNFSEPLPPARLPWTTQELEQLRAHGVEFPTPETLAVMETERWLRPILSAKKQLILVYPRERAGEPVAHHPLLTRLVSLLDKESKPLPVVDLDHLISTGKAAAPWHFVQVNHRPLPALSRWWKTNTSEHLQPREVESYSSAEKFIYDPSAWVLQYKAGLKAGPVASLRLQADYRQEGTLLHRMLDLLLVAGNSINWQTCSQSELDSWLEGVWPPLLEQEGANLLLPGKRADALGLLELGRQAMWQLLFQLRQAKVVEARANETLQPVSFAGGQISGIIDLLVRNQQDGIAVVDLKFGGRKVREKELQENRPLQLAIYGHVLRGQGQKDWPASAFFLLRRRRLIATAKTFCPEAKVVTSKFPPGELHQCWTDFEHVWRWRRQQLDEGWIELTTVGLDASESPDEAPDSTPPLPHWASNEDHARYNDFDALTGWRADA